jgi:uncharacterized membrane protein YkvA (DUF1232 family)
MSDLIGLLELAMGLVAALIVVFVIALSMPQSKFREVMKGMVLVLIAFIYVFSPVDLVPEVVFGLFGLVDDLGVAVAGVVKAKRILQMAKTDSQDSSLT